MIVTDVGGLKEMCPDGKVGYVVSPHADEIKAILKFFNETNINEMIENINQIKEQYSWSIFTKKLLALTSSKEQHIIMKQDLIRRNISDSITVKQELLQNDDIMVDITKVADLIVEAFNNGNKLLFCGNGGSAADAQHLAAEFSGRYYLNRPPLHAEALHTDTSFMTAVSNDFSFDEVYARLIQGIGKQGDILIGMSTSGNSKNVIKALEEAKEKHNYNRVHEEK